MKLCRSQVIMFLTVYSWQYSLAEIKILPCLRFSGLQIEVEDCKNKTVFSAKLSAKHVLRINSLNDDITYVLAMNSIEKDSLRSR